jgi:hypothetical protein
VVFKPIERNQIAHAFAALGCECRVDDDNDITLLPSEVSLPSIHGFPSLKEKKKMT